MAVCAEAVALGQAITVAGEVRHRDDRRGAASAARGKGSAIAVVSPCGACRELIWDYDRNARVIVPGRDSPETVGIGELIPNKYSRERGT